MAAKLDFPHDIENKYGSELNKLITDIEKKFKKIFLKGEKVNSVNNVKINKENKLLSLVEYQKEKSEGVRIDLRERKNADETPETKEFLDYWDNYLTDQVAFEISIDYIMDGVQFAINEVEEQMIEILALDYTKQPFYDEAAIEEVLNDNILLIKAEPGKYLRTYDKQLKKILKEKDITGATVQEIAEAIEKTTGIERNRANLIARDQIGNIYADSTKRQMEGIGLQKFRWITVGDSRVRPEHAERNGETFKWNDPPDGEIPSQPIACRCVAGVVREEVLEL